ncbi:MAG: hypothetical protein FWG10_10375 [Eubacteriaceae bacterium]|nr:hypothetical protein [Eubacteriaceae bacterium]
MKDFIEQVELHLRSKSPQELRAFVGRLASKVPEDLQQEFLLVLENKKVIVSDPERQDIGSGFLSKAQADLGRIRILLAKTDDYKVKAHYDGEGWFGERFVLDGDDGFIDEFAYCYNLAEVLLSTGQFKEAAQAFRMLFQVIENFDARHEKNETGAFYITTLIDEGLLNIDYKTAKALRAYSALMANEEGLREELEHIFALSNTIYNRLMLRDILEAGSMPVPGLEAVYLAWQDIISSQAPEKSLAYVKELAVLSDDMSVMERYSEGEGKGEPSVYLDLCEMLAARDTPGEKIAQVAAKGLANTEANARKREELATLLANTAKSLWDSEAYTFAVLERFYSRKDLKNYMPVYELGSKQANTAAIESLDLAEGLTRSADYCIIHLLNYNYDRVFEIVSTDDTSLGWSSSLKGVLFPFFMGLVAGFPQEAAMIKLLINDSSRGADGMQVYNSLKDNMGEITEEQYNAWFDWCEVEVRNRSEAILSGKHRSSYYKVARLLVANCEMKLYGKQALASEAAFAILHEFWAKYVRQPAFKETIRAALQEAKLKVDL